MNLFSNLEDIYRLSSGADEFIADVRGFQCLYREMYEKLGNQGYLLGQYVSGIFDEISLPSAYSSMYDGSSYFQQLRNLCRDAWNGKANDHPFYKRVEEYVRETPLPNQDETIRICLYIIGLSGEWLDYATSEHRRGLRLYSKLEPHILRQSYDRIAEALGGESELEMLNGYICRRFLPNPPVAAFIQGFTDTLLKSFTAFDPETRRYCYELAGDMLSTRED